MNALLHRLLLLLVPLSILSTTYLYTYPIPHRCAFPLSDACAKSAAPFRLLAFGDPQLEGDSSLPNPDDGHFPSLRTLRQDLYASASVAQQILVAIHALKDLFANDVLGLLKSYRKKLDLLGNDYYLAHIYRTLYWSLNPTHVTVLGDLLGSQWISDEEFERRGLRFWHKVFNGGQMVEQDMAEGVHVEVLGQDERWKRRVINIAGNHDVGYAGDMTVERVQRFQKVFGRPNWEIRFALPSNHTEGLDDTLPALRIVVLNSLNLDTPALDEELQGVSYKFINDIITASRPVEDLKTGTILLTHLPLHKDDGVCVDSPYFNFYGEQDGGGVKEQNHLSYHASKGILEGLYGMSGNPEAPGGGFGRNGIILTGHDHEGCDVYHYLPKAIDDDSPKWAARRWESLVMQGDEKIPGIREITVRSMMGGFGGNAGLLSAWFNTETERWKFEYSTCSLGVQHIWWAIHILDVVTIVLLSLSALTNFHHHHHDNASVPRVGDPSDRDQQRGDQSKDFDSLQEIRQTGSKGHDGRHPTDGGGTRLRRG